VAERLAEDVKALGDKIGALVSARMEALGSGEGTGEGEVKARLAAIDSEVGDSLSAVLLGIEQEVAAATERYGQETARQDSLLEAANQSSAVFRLNGEVAALGLTIDGLTLRLLGANTVAEIEVLTAQMGAAFGAATARSGELEGSLTTLGAKEEIELLKMAVASLTSTRSLLFDQGGVSQKQRRKLEMRDQAAAATKQIREFVRQQSQRGKEAVGHASAEQEQAIVSVNRVVRFCTVLTVVISVCAVLLGLGFGVWVYRSISWPLRQLLEASEAVARNSGETSDAAGTMRQLADDGKNSMHVTVQELTTFARTVREAATGVEALGAQSQQISGVVALIDDIANQTNLLALNAAIEAARAGESGRGFAVLAEEVRALAQRTTRATREIGDTVKAMQGKVGESVAFMQDERTSVDTVLGLVGDTLRHIDAIASQVEQVTDMVQRIAVATEEQSCSTSEVSRNMEGLADITRQIQGSFSEIRTSADGLAGLASELNAMVSWFRV